MQGTEGSEEIRRLLDETKDSLLSEIEKLRDNQKKLGMALSMIQRDIDKLHIKHEAFDTIAKRENELVMRTHALHQDVLDIYEVLDKTKGQIELMIQCML